MVTVIRNAKVFAPQCLGEKDIVISSERIVDIVDRGTFKASGIELTEIDAAGKVVCPGFVDNHVHVLGGGGGLGFASRAPELQTSQLVRAGITSVIGMLGFDATTKNMASLVAKTKAFIQDGISAYCVTGATLEHPIPTLTGRIRTDLAYVNEIIGVGEISISELGYGYDSFGAGAQYIAKAATESLLAGRLSGKSGYLCLQVPPYLKQVLRPVFDIVDRTGLPITQFLPSHVNQTDGYMSDAIDWGKRGGYVDIGANYSPENNFSRATLPSKAYGILRAAGVPASRITMSSDGNGAPPKEEAGENKPKVANYMPVRSLHAVWKRWVREEGVDIAEALGPVTSNPAAIAGLSSKGKLARGADADLVFLDDDLNIETVVARGVVHFSSGDLIRQGMFDRTILNELGIVA
ncbi:amidohydrolase family protein [Rhodopseudomonas pseudopalustris]|uniref:Beta-aspartyl-dipeptidase (Metallo-type) n=1 Tax=Rhodopseudomonas pseudopalustris TaxID=1513892 RepID=A0A1H8M9H8_9BRAD|nr:amidohydrolase family protein [Rhodopseudomonas pseudopalustris]SEO13796.1 beta-aspartyl-dipeptidase (metallo-type) [Rhodopseudomonas pseudopalustris]